MAEKQQESPRGQRKGGKSMYLCHCYLLWALWASWEKRCISNNNNNIPYKLIAWQCFWICEKEEKSISYLINCFNFEKTLQIEPKRELHLNRLGGHRYMYVAFVCLIIQTSDWNNDQCPGWLGRVFLQNSSIFFFSKPQIYPENLKR